MVACVLTLGFAACGGDNSSDEGATTAVSSTAVPQGTATSAPPATTATSGAVTTAAPSITSPSTPCAGTGGDTSTVMSPTPSGAMLLTGVDVMPADACSDTVTMVFRPDVEEVPGFTLGYQDGPFSAAGSGEPIPVLGGAYLVLRLEPAAIVDLSDAAAPLTYDGPQDIEPDGTNHVVQMRVYDAFEGVLGWVIGLDSLQPFVVETGASPPSLTISIG